MEDTNTQIFNSMIGMFGSIKNFAEQTLKTTRSAVIRFWNTEAVQSMKSALGNIVSSIGGHINEVLGPVKEMFDMTFGVVKSIALFGIMIGKSIKNLFFPKRDEGAEEQKEQTSWLGKIWNALMHPKKDKSEFREGIGKGGKKTRWLETILIGAGVLLLGFFTGIFESFNIWGERIKTTIGKIKLPKFLKNIGKWKPFRKIGEFFTRMKNRIRAIKLPTFLKDIGKWKPFRKIGEFFTRMKEKLKMIKLPKKGILGILGKLGKLMGRAFLPIILLWEAFKGWQLGDDFWEKVSGAGAGIISTLAAIPEMLINLILAPFTDFRIDFSTKAIFEGLKNIKQWVFDNITVPVCDFFTIMVPKIFTNIVDCIKKPIQDIIDFFTKERGADESLIGDIIQKVKDVFSAIKQWLLDSIPSPSKILKSGMDAIKGFFSSDDEEITKPLKPSHKIRGKIIDRPDVQKKSEVKEDKTNKEQADILKLLLEEMKKSNNERQKQTSSINSAISINSKTENNMPEPVDSIENAGLLLQNSALG